MRLVQKNFTSFVLAIKNTISNSQKVLTDKTWTRVRFFCNTFFQFLKDVSPVCHCLILAMHHKQSLCCRRKTVRFTHLPIVSCDFPWEIWEFGTFSCCCWGKYAQIHEDASQQTAKIFHQTRTNQLHETTECTHKESIGMSPICFEFDCSSNCVSSRAKTPNPNLTLPKPKPNPNPNPNPTLTQTVT